MTKFFFNNLERSYPVQLPTLCKLVHVFCVYIFWLSVAQNKKLIEGIELKEFHVNILFWNYKRLSIQLRSNCPELLCKKVFNTSQSSQENIYAGVSLLRKL